MVAGMLAGAVAAAVLATGGGAADVAAGSSWARAEAYFAPPSAFIPSPAVTYDTGLVPAASWIEVEQHSVEGATNVTLKVRGMKPGYAYGVHVHQRPCGAEPEAAGGHYQHRVDPVQPSKDPAYANAENEVWLDFTAGADGSGSVSAQHAWGFRPGEAASVVLHDEPGGAGDRAACFTVPFAALPEAQQSGGAWGA
ncbi:superoxide dismutase family protein [Streptomyces atriruber]|uniref:superoxide dismutase family protein n=1 Tax=Streptomyces atriruber TaxID=545121 RepID=UPI0006E32BDC|nr:superoxide dismutase family protein [Streptomyces atriruber]